MPRPDAVQASRQTAAAAFPEGSKRCAEVRAKASPSPRPARIAADHYNTGPDLRKRLRARRNEHPHSGNSPLASWLPISMPMSSSVTASAPTSRSRWGCEPVLGIAGAALSALLVHGRVDGPAHARPARRRCGHLPFALVLKMISGMPKGAVPDNRRAALVAEPQKNDPRFEHRNMHSVLRCYDRPIHCPRHDQPPSPIPNGSCSRVPGRVPRADEREAFALDLRHCTTWYRAAP